MKKLILGLLLGFFALSINAQSKSQFTQEQLKVALVKAKILKGTGIVLIISGCALLVGTDKYLETHPNYQKDREPRDRGYESYFFGPLVIASGIPLLAIGWTKKRHIKVALTKFNGSASINGIGIKIRF